MKTVFPIKKFRQTASALMLTMIMCGIALAILASAMSWSANSTRLTQRSIQYSRSIAAAEASTEKVLSHITKDFIDGGPQEVSDNLVTYRQLVPTSADSTFWSQWEFNDANGNVGHNFVGGGAGNYGDYAGLKGYSITYTVVSHARDAAAVQDVVAGVLQQVQLISVPIFQECLYSSGNMEISCGQPFTVTGRVHANKTLYIEPDNLLTFLSDVTAVENIVYARNPDEGPARGAPKGGHVYVQPDLVNPHASALTLPIGTNNTPEAIREILQPPPVGEDSTSALFRQRFYNQADMILIVSNSGISATSGRFNGFTTPIPSSELATFVTTGNSFTDTRENKTVRPIDIDVGNLTLWSQNNSDLRVALGSNDLRSVYILDKRNLSTSKLAAVRVINGTQLPGHGLTVVTARPLYVLGNFNQTNVANLGTTNTSTTQPAALIADAVTILSTAWSDANSKDPLKSRVAAPTTVNAAILTGAVETTIDHYSGGMENFPRFLESWGPIVFTYNGSMVKMFPSLYATNAWGKDQVYDPPKRNWAYDLNFEDVNKLPPMTPHLVIVNRGQWATVPPNQNTVAAGP